MLPALSCLQPVRSFEATFSDEGLLTIIGCRPDERQEYTPLPSTRGWDEEAKTHEQASYQTSVLRAMKVRWGVRKECQPARNECAMQVHAGGQPCNALQEAQCLDQLTPHHAVLPTRQAERYTKPVQLNATEAVLARCGDAERLLLRVKRLASRPTPEPPLATREAEPKAAATAGKPPRLNVLVLFIDSLGRRHFFRRMPKAAAALEAVHRSHKASLFQFFRWSWGWVMCDVAGVRG